MKKLTVLAIAAVLVVGVVPAAAGSTPDVVGTVLAVSGGSGFDDEKKDFDLLREAVLATGLADDLSAADGITVFAPNDYAFYRLAKDLGYDGGYDEGAVLEFLLAGLAAYGGGDAIGVLTNVLLYHVVGEELTRKDMRKGGVYTTLLGADIEVLKNGKIVDAEPDLKDAKLKSPKDVMASNGIIQTIDRILIPVPDLAS